MNLKNSSYSKSRLNFSPHLCHFLFTNFLCRYLSKIALKTWATNADAKKVYLVRSFKMNGYPSETLQVRFR